MITNSQITHVHNQIKLTASKGKAWLIAQVKANPIAIISVLVICIIMINLIAQLSTKSEKTSLATAYLAINYLILVTMAFSRFYTKQKKTAKNNSGISTIRNWINQHNIAISLVVAVSVLSIFQHTHQITITNNLTIAFSYALIFYWVITYLKNKLTTNPRGFDLKSHRIYFIYALCIALSFFLATTVDDSVRYGTHFQLVMLSWLMLLHLIISWLMEQWKLVKQLSNEKTSAELMHLKSQVNPHFLFNTLNNLYGLAREKSDETPALILKLSDMLRYSIYQGKRDCVLLSEEISYLDDFIQLQQVRYHKTVKINFNRPTNTDELFISPLLFIILLENAYKHGVEKLTHDAFIDINLKVDDHSMLFEIKNNFDPQEVSSNPGIGLNNLQRRLCLIYPNSHQLEISNSDNIYSAELKIELPAVDKLAL